MVIYGLDMDCKAYNTQTTLLDYVYLHGELDDDNGYDLIGVSEETYDVLTSCHFGKFDVDVVLHNGQEEKGVLFYWHDEIGRRRGLVVRGTDIKNKIYAEEKFKCFASVV